MAARILPIGRSRASADAPPGPARFDAPLLGPWCGRLGPAFALAITAFLLMRLWGYAMDDAWITYRYGRNLAEGHGVVFNPGERVEGYSNFLIVAGSAVLHRLRMDPFDWVRLGGAMCLLAGVGLTGLMERRIVHEQRQLAEAPSYIQFLFPGGRAAGAAWAWAGTFYLALCYQAAAWAVSGLETAYYLLAVVATMYCAARAWASPIDETRDAARERYLWGLSAGSGALLAALIRVDGFVLAGALLVFVGWEVARNRRPADWKPVLAGVLLFFVGYGIYTGWRVAYFGSLFPNTAQAKVTGPLSSRIRDGASYLWEWFRAGGSVGLAVAVWGGWLTLRDFRGARPGVRRTSTEAPTILRLAMAVAIAHLLLIVYAGGDWMPASRFVVPILGLIGLLAGAGLRRWRQRGFLGWTTAAVAALWILISLWHGYRSDHTLRWCVEAARTQTLVQPLERIGEWIGAVAPEDEWLAATEAGIVPYCSRLRFIDMLGLVDPHIASLPGGLHEKFDAGYVLGRQPRYILLGVTHEEGPDGWPARGIWHPDDQMLNHPDFRDQYAPRHTWERPFPEPDTILMVLYERGREKIDRAGDGNLDRARPAN